MNNSKQNGYGLIEIIIVATVGVTVFLSVSVCLISFMKVALLNIDNTEALFLAKSSLEQARAVRDEKWENISGLVLEYPYHFDPSEETSPEKWVALPETKSEDKYTIWVTISEVRRDGNDDIVSVGGDVDGNTLKVVSNVSWSASSGAKQISLYEYLTNFR